MGQFKRTLKSWQADIAKVWGRLRTFHRIALGITIGMAIIYIARGQLLDPLKGQLIKQEKSLEKKGVPQVILPADKCDDLINASEKLANLKRSYPNWQRRKNLAIKSRPQIDPAGIGEVVAELELLIVRSGLVLQNRQRAIFDESSEDKPRGKADRRKTVKTEKPKLPLESKKYQYELGGTFQSVCEFFDKIQEFKYPASLSRIEVLLAESNATDAAANEEPRLIVKFILELYCRER